MRYIERDELDRVANDLGKRLTDLELNRASIFNYGATTPIAVNAAECRGSMLTNVNAGADTHFDLPAAAVGMRIEFFVAAAQTITIDPNGSDRIMIVTGTAGDYLRSDTVIGTYVNLICIKASEWQVLYYKGVWTEE